VTPSTTIPETLPAGRRVAFHPQFQYEAAADGDGEANIHESRPY